MNTDEFDGMCFCTLYNQEVNQKSYIRRIDKCPIRVKKFIFK
jgi:hypothetical protein